MEQETIVVDSKILYPILFIPKRGTKLEITYELTDNVLIDVNITSPDTAGVKVCIYSGLCNIKLVDNYDIKVQQTSDQDDVPEYDDQIPIIIADTSQTLPMFDQSEVWIDPSRSPYVYNQSDSPVSHEFYSERLQTQSSHITVQQHNTYITNNVYNYKEAVRYSRPEEFDHKKFRNYPENHNNYAENEFECGVFLSQLPGEIINEKLVKEKEERKYVGLQSEDGALKQLMSSDIQSGSKQRKTILFLGHDSHSGKTVQKIAMMDTTLQCPLAEVDNEVVIEDNDPNPKKKYQCAKCQQIFDQISEFRDHMGNHRSTRSKAKPRSTSEVNFLCIECGKNLKSKDKFESHCRGHGDPEVECDKCRKVFASKFTLRAHRKIHDRKYPCRYCSKTYSKLEEIRAHVSRTHYMFMCDSCNFCASNVSELTDHQTVHEKFYMRDSSETEFAESFLDDVMSESDMITPSPEDHDWALENDDSQDNSVLLSGEEEIHRNADSVLAKVMLNKIFLSSNKPKRHRGFNKVCEVCCKNFDRVSDLKRHLIEHVVRSTLDKNPVNKNGTLNIRCEVCQAETFTRIDRYKAHLREHAKLTLYQCTFCNKSFSDSSNFSKHKKIHGDTFLQCDLCQRKFNSKKMLTQHMEYHIQNSPLECSYCDKEFYFESTLNKHIKGVHTRKLNCRFRCKFCHKYFQSLKDKWDHEWSVHNVRKMIVDCLICGAKFRKYSELKRHCTNEHGMDIPRAKKLLKKK